MKLNPYAMKRIFASIIATLGLAVFTSCSDTEEQSRKDSQTTAPPEITRVVGVARIEPEKGLLYIYSSASGKIESIQADENAIVNQDEILVSLEQVTDLAQLNQERSKISYQESAIQSAEANANAIQSDLQKANEDVTLNEKLLTARASTEQTLNDSKAKVAKLLFEYKKQQAEVSQTKNKMDEINANIQYKKAVMAEKQIRASFDGKILQWDVQKGDYINAGQKLGQFAPKGALVAVTEVDEVFADRVSIGMKAEIISQLDARKIGEGEVVFIAGFLKKKSLFSDENAVEDRRVREVRIRLNPTSQIVINNKVDCAIYLK